MKLQYALLLLGKAVRAQPVISLANALYAWLRRLHDRTGSYRLQLVLLRCRAPLLALQKLSFEVSLDLLCVSVLLLQFQYEEFQTEQFWNEAAQSFIRPRIFGPFLKGCCYVENLLQYPGRVLKAGQ